MQVSLPMQKLAGKTALITGASKGLGKAMALALGKAGARLVLVSRNLEQTQATAQAVQAEGGSAEAFQADLTDEQQVAKFASDVTSKVGNVHILINNAGINIRKSRSPTSPSRNGIRSRTRTSPACS